MRMKEIFTAKSIEEAKHLAVEKFGVSEDQIVFRILEEPKKGIFGKVKREAQVEAVYEAAEEAAPAETTEAKAPEQPEAPQPQAEAAPAMPVSRPVQEAVSSVEEIIIDKDDNSPTRGMESEAIETILTEGEMSPNLLRARQYIASAPCVPQTAFAWNFAAIIKAARSSADEAKHWIPFSIWHRFW